MRVLGAVRLSKFTDTSTSVERQHEVIRWWSSGQDRELTHTAEDIDVSGAVSPFEREGLGPWLTDPAKVRQWDVLVAWKLDRISRNARDTLELLTWAEAHGKRIVCVDDSIDTESEMGRFFLQLAAIFAELERKTIRARILKGQAARRTQGRYSGGQVRYGYRRDESGDVVPDAEVADILTEMIRRYLAGDSRDAIAAHLNAEGHPSPGDHQFKLSGKPAKGTAWRGTAVQDILTSGQLRGWLLHHGEPVTFEGEVVQLAEPVITADTFRQIQEEQKRRARPHEVQHRRDGHPLSPVLRCYECGARLYVRRQRYEKYPTVIYFYCPAGHTGQMRSEMIEEVLADAFLSEYGDEPVREVTHHPKVDHSEQVAKLREDVQTLTTLMLGMTGSVREDYAEMIQERAALASQLEAEQQEETTEVVTLGETYRDRWAAAETLTARAEMLVRAGVQLRIQQPKRSNALTFEVYVEAA